MLLGMSLPTLWTPTAYHSTPDFQNLKNTPLIQPSIHFILEAPQNQNVLASLSRPFLLWNGKISSGSNLKVCNVIKTRDDLCHSTAHRLKVKILNPRIHMAWPLPVSPALPCSPLLILLQPPSLLSNLPWSLSSPSLWTYWPFNTPTFM